MIFMGKSTVSGSDFPNKTNPLIVGLPTIYSDFFPLKMVDLPTIYSETSEFFVPVHCMAAHVFAGAPCLGTGLQQILKGCNDQWPFQEPTLW